MIGWRITGEEMQEIERTIQAVSGYLDLGMLLEAWDELESLAPEDRANVNVITLRLEILQRLEKWESARVIAESMATKFPENPDWWIAWAYALRREKSIEEARGVLCEAVQRHPGVALISYNLGCYASVLGEMDEAKKLLHRAFSLDPELKMTALDDPDLSCWFGALAGKGGGLGM